MKYRTILLFFVLLISVSKLYGQKAQDSLFIERHVKLRNLVIENPSGALEEAHKLKSDKRDISNQGLAFLISGNSKWVMGEYPSALQYYYEAMQKFEESANTYGRITTYNDASLVHIEQMDYEDGLKALHKARDLNSTYGSIWLKAVIYSNLGDVFLRTDQLDSAWYYTDLSFTYATQAQDSSLYPFILKNLGLIHLMEDNLPMAKKKFDKSLQVASAINDAIHEIEIVEVVGDYFREIEQLDTAFKYYRHGMALAELIEDKKEILGHSEKLQTLFEELGQYDSAYYYSKKAKFLKDGIFGADKIRLSEHYEVMEDLRQEELRAEKERKLEAQKHLMEYTVIGILILLLIGLSFMLRKVKIPAFWFEAFLIIILLMIFECITLIVHTYAAEITHHSPILMLLILVAIASILSPLHHQSLKYAKMKFIGEKEEL